ncbi:plastocyanin/azurin family copper-binding protein [Jannaschia sp. W003]|uniref:cupredoxin domain-containing protein n=1 Tax=Jannaschia sp. W003 TaxID=2867012 RepID=UPI0021A374C0|nr:plastocyanin/azurin family copper-binding protein [Jannaschia sp. W003]UWQ22927.1 hypothetical protein K3554_07850 [Jannaschia sp. W003]
MKRLIAALAPLALVAACATSGPAVDGAVPAGVAATVDMQPVLRFAPDPVRIRAGETVEFRNVSAFAHTVSTRPSTPAEAADVALPAGAEAFDSGEIPAGGVYRHTFTVPGTYRYFCDPHHGAGMVGTVLVS